MPPLVCPWQKTTYGGSMATRVREKRFMSHKGAAIDRGWFCVLTIFYTRVCLRILCSGLSPPFPPYKNLER
jgi:hypothetical protein